MTEKTEYEWTEYPNNPPKSVAYVAPPGVGLGPGSLYPAILTFANPARNKLLLEIFEEVDKLPEAPVEEACMKLKNQFPDISNQTVIDMMILYCAIYVQCIERLRSSSSAQAQTHQYIPYHNRHCYTTKGPCEVMLPAECGCGCEGCSPEKES